MVGSVIRPSWLTSSPGLGAGRLLWDCFQIGGRYGGPISSQPSYRDCLLSLESQHRISIKSYNRRLMQASSEGGLSAFRVKQADNDSL